jgi:hypothetical protein
MAEPLLTRTLVALTDAGVAFVVCGGVACVLQGVQRATHDLDVRAVLADDNLARLVGVARALGLRPRIPEPLEALLDGERRRVWVEEKHAVVYTLLAEDGRFALDVFLAYPLSYDELRSRADQLEIEGRPIFVSSKRDLITAKRAVQPPRKTDLRDIEDLEELLDE